MNIYPMALISLEAPTLDTLLHEQFATVKKKQKNKNPGKSTWKPFLVSK